MLEDTPRDSQRRYTELLRAMSPEQRLAATEGMCRGVRRAAWLSLEAQFPGATEGELRVRLMARLYGRAEALRVFGSVPDDAR